MTKEDFVEGKLYYLDSSGTKWLVIFKEHRGNNHISAYGSYCISSKRVYRGENWGNLDNIIEMREATPEEYALFKTYSSALDLVPKDISINYQIY